MGRLRRLGMALVLLMGLYGGFIAVCLLLRVLAGERLRPIMLFNSVLPAALFPCLMFLLVCVLARRWRVAVLQMPALLAFFLMYGYVFLPSIVPAASNSAQISILTFNISLRNGNFEAIERLIRDADADVVALQEVNRASYFYLYDTLGDVYPYQAFHPDTAPPGQGVMSKYPILEDSYWQVERAHQRVLLDFNGIPITLYNVHPVHFNLSRRALLSFEGQLREVDDILARVTHEEGALLIAGDFNTTDQTEMYGRFAQHYGDAFRAVGSGFGLTFPVWLPLARLDYVFYNTAFIPLEARVWSTTGGSDHHPLYARFGISDE